MIEKLFQLGEPLVHRGVVVVPLFPRLDPVAQYLTLDEALPLGLRVREVDEQGSVPELLVDNPLSEDVLLYDGEELTGAKQDRILNVSVLVAGKSRLRIPVSCVEMGRWQSVSAHFDSAPQTAQPQLRRRKAQALQAEPFARGIAQSDVWEEVALTADRLAVLSPSNANTDTFRAHRPALAELEQAFPLQPGQCGAALALGEDLCLDAVSRPAAFERLWPKLRVGYLLDALDRLDRSPAESAAVDRFVAMVAATPVTRRPSAGRGEDLRGSTATVVASGLALEGEVVQASAFTRGAGRERRGRISRPSGRRRA